jgi:hypothetical protein
MCNDKSKKCNKGTCALWVSIAALLLCLIVFGLWIFEAIPHSVVTPDSFIGTCVSVLSIIVTIAIGWQIFNVVEVKNTMKELKEKQDEVDKLRIDIKRIKDESEDAKHYSAHLHAMTLSMIYADANRYDIAFIQSLTALAECMQMKDPLNANFIIKGIKTCLDKHKGSIFVKQAVKQDVLAMNQIVRKSKDFSWIESEYDEIYKQYMSRLKVEGE